LGKGTIQLDFEDAENLIPVLALRIAKLSSSVDTYLFQCKDIYGENLDHILICVHENLPTKTSENNEADQEQFLHKQVIVPQVLYGKYLVRGKIESSFQDLVLITEQHDGNNDCQKGGSDESQFNSNTSSALLKLMKF